MLTSVYGNPCFSPFSQCECTPAEIPATPCLSTLELPDQLTEQVIAEGTLGIITEILVKLIAKPQFSKTMTATFDALKDAGYAISGIIANKYNL